MSISRPRIHDLLLSYADIAISNNVGLKARCGDCLTNLQKCWLQSTFWRCWSRRPFTCCISSSLVYNHRSKQMKKIVMALLLSALPISSVFACEASYVKYRSTSVCLDEFEYQDTSRSSFVRGAWYDASNDYMLISLKGTTYHYCRVPRHVWKAFKNAPSFGRFYGSNLKGAYDCRLGGVPAY